ncbi:MAG: site-2 protease family protein [Candidatus Acidiferrales bacterium]
MHEGNREEPLQAEIVESPFAYPPEIAERVSAPPPRRIWLALVLFLLTVISTLAVGAQFAISYAHNEAPFANADDLLGTFSAPFLHPKLLLLGVPFSFALLGILLAHELGHFFACRYYGIDASYPYFIPAPTLFGTFGAFIRIRSPITTRRALFDVGLSGPVAGFLFTIPALALAVQHSKIVPGVEADAPIIFGHPLLLRLFIYLFHPGIRPEDLLLHPIARAAWVGMFATALNLIPCWQLDGGHILYSLASRNHRRISLGVALLLFAVGLLFWHVWAIWGFVLLILSLRYRHPPLLYRWEGLGAERRLWAFAGILIFILCFTLWPTNNSF